MKYLILPLLFLTLSCSKQVEEVKLNDLYTFTAFYTTGYSSTADTTLVNVSETCICIWNDNLAYCDAITSKTTEALNLQKPINATIITTDANVTYNIYDVNGEVRSMSFTSQLGEPIKLGDIFSVRKVEWQPIATRAGWFVSMN